MLEKILTIVLAGGKGTRIQNISTEVPKPMILLENKPVLHHIIKNVRKYGIRNFLFKTSYLSEKIENYFQNGQNYDCKIDYFIEKEPLGTAGGLNYLKNNKTPVLILYGDVLLNLNLKKLLEFHYEKKSQATIVVHESNHPEDSDVITLDENKRVTNSIHKPGTKKYGNLTNAALYVLNPECFSFIPEKQSYDFGKNLVPQIMNLNVYGYETKEYLKDMGTSERFSKVTKDLQEGKIINRVDAVFLDRDGVINEEIGNLHKKEQLKIIKQAPAGIKILNEENIPAIVITNQPVVAKNLCNEQELIEINTHLQKLLNEQNAYVDEIFYCPHHPDKGYPEENKNYKINCECRKPKTGMIEKAKEKFSINPENCFIIGDMTSDIKTGINANCRTILVNTGYKGTDKKYEVQPDYEFDNLEDACKFIKKYNSSNISSIISKIEENNLILIGGCARTGKTTLSENIKTILKTKNITSQIITLDSWIKDYEQRPVDGKVYQKFDYEKIVKDVTDLLNNKTIKITNYDRENRKQSEEYEVLTLNSKVLIIEGVVALDIPDLRNISNIKIFKDERDNIRIKRLEELLKTRKLSDDEIRNEINKRENEEVKYIKKTAIYADYII